MAVYLLDDSLKVDVYYDQKDCEFEDNICLSVFEECPEEEKLFRAGQTNLYLTSEQARLLGQALIEAAAKSEQACAGRQPKQA